MQLPGLHLYVTSHPARKIVRWLPRMSVDQFRVNWVLEQNWERCYLGVIRLQVQITFTCRRDFDMK